MCASPVLQLITARRFNKAKVRKVLVIAIGEIGDMIRLFPFLKSLRGAFPDAEIVLLTTLPENHDVWKLLHKSIRINRKIVIDIKNVHRSILPKLKLFNDLRKYGFDLTIDTSRGGGMGPNSLMSFLIGSRHRVGFRKEGIGCLNTVRVEFRDDEYIGTQNLRLLEAIGISSAKAGTDIQVPHVSSYPDSLFDGLRWPVISMHPAANWNGQQRCWPPEYYSELAKKLMQEYGATIVLLGDKTEMNLTDKIAEKVKGTDIINMAGKTTLAEAAMIIKKSHLFIGNDSSLLHIASALKVPAVGIFGPTSPEQVLPQSIYCSTVYKDISCRPCYTHQPLFSAACSHKECLTELTVDEVMDAVSGMLSRFVKEDSVRTLNKAV